MEDLKPSALTCHMTKFLRMARVNKLPIQLHSICIKKILQQYPGQECNLAGLILEEAMSGLFVSTLVLSYLTPAVLGQLVPCSDVLTAISNYRNFSRPQCVKALVDQAVKFTKPFNFSPGPDILVCCRSLLRLLQWLLACLRAFLQQARNSKSCPEDELAVLQAASHLVVDITHRPVPILRGFLLVACADGAEASEELQKTTQAVHSLLRQVHGKTVPGSTLKKVLAAVKACSELQGKVRSEESVLGGRRGGPTCPPIQGVVTLEALLNPTRDAAPFVQQLQQLAGLLKMEWSEVYGHVFRACFQGMQDARDKPEEYLWAGFTFLKIPQLLLRMKQQLSLVEQARDLEAALNQFLASGTLQKPAESRQKMDCLDVLFAELRLSKLISAQQIKNLHEKRLMLDAALLADRDTDMDQGTIVIQTHTKAVEVLRAKNSVPELKKTLSCLCDCAMALDENCLQNQEILVGQLQEMLGGFEFIMTAAAPLGELADFASIFNRLNEFACHPRDDNSQSRALLFDVTFLMLCHLSQEYGTEILEGGNKGSELFMTSWIKTCMPVDGKYANPESAPQDSSLVDVLLSYLSKDAEVCINKIQWHKVCWNLPFAAGEILLAYEQGVIGFDMVQECLGRVQGWLCCLPVVLSVWLCGRLALLPSQTRAKSLQVLEYLAQSPPCPSTHNASKVKLMAKVMQRVMTPILPPEHPLSRPTQEALPLHLLPVELLRETLEEVFRQGGIALSALHRLKNLLQLLGPRQFMERIVMTLMEKTDAGELNQALQAVVAILHLDLDEMMLHLLDSILMRMLLSRDVSCLLAPPHCHTLARLAVAAIVAAQGSRLSGGEPFTRPGIRHLQPELSEGEEDADCRMCSPEEPHVDPIPKPDVNTLSECPESGKYQPLGTADERKQSSSPALNPKDPISKALANLSMLMADLAEEGDTSARIDFTLAFLGEASKCEARCAHYISQFLPPNTLVQLMRIRPSALRVDQILALCNLSTLNGRKVAAEAIWILHQLEKETMWKQQPQQQQQQQQRQEAVAGCEKSASAASCVQHPS